MGTVLSYVLLVLQNLPALIKAGVDVAAIIEDTYAKAKAMIAQNRDPSDAEWADMHNQIIQLRTKLDA